jgi:hypothetical protein
MATRLDRVIPWLKVTLALASVGILVLFRLYFLPPPRLDIEAQRAVSPDGRHVVTHTYDDGFGGATVRYFHLVDLSRTGWPKLPTPLLETYGSPERIAIRWIDSRNLEIVGFGMKNVDVNDKFAEDNWDGINVRIQLRDD